MSSVNFNDSNSTLKQIFVKTSRGSRTFEITTDMTVFQLKQLIFEKENIPSSIYYLSYGGHVLDNRCILSDYNISKESTIELVIRACGSILRPPFLERQLNEQKWINGLKVACITDRPCMVSIYYKNEQKIFYIVYPNGKRINGNLNEVSTILNQDGFIFSNVVQLEYVGKILSNI